MKKVLVAMLVMSGCASLRDLPEHGYGTPCQVDRVHIHLDTPQAVHAGCAVTSENDEGGTTINEGDQVLGCFVVKGKEGAEEVYVTLTDSVHVWEHEFRHVFNYFCNKARLKKEADARLSPEDRAYMANPCAAMPDGKCPPDWKR